MSEGEKNDRLGSVLKDLLKQKSFSMRKLSALTGIDTATISRIINGKRKATPGHLQKFADCLDVQAAALFSAAGYINEEKQEKVYANDIYQSAESVQYILESTNLVNKKFSIESVENELLTYQQFSQTEEGKETILIGFEEKVKKLGSVGPIVNQLQNMFDEFCSMKASPQHLAIIGGALLYFIFPVDVIPDYLLPVGYLDDAIAVKLVLGGLKAK
ncbi:DUF1232 domain-containing protein [Cytobacillus depressus]|uniref:DUF1232 domain-containing protein n=1 Tax=Cytobacillus depressus TaxID=1602942 RepID=A0A6L3V5U2_9BACI|nr:DUF1232 domain-containing protein [Cytobacillus depressus]KAB2334862.1 DUF1232 domain-containing protein [Cytobacillus depressus]